MITAIDSWVQDGSALVTSYFADSGFRVRFKGDIVTDRIIEIFYVCVADVGWYHRGK